MKIAIAATATDNDIIRHNLRSDENTTIQILNFSISVITGLRIIRLECTYSRCCHFLNLITYLLESPSSVGAEYWGLQVSRVDRLWVWPGLPFPELHFDYLLYEPVTS